MTVSVIMTCHNEEQYIEQAVRSVLAQTAFDQISEIIVVNDGSRDGSQAILQRLQAETDQLRVIETPGVGLAAVRNQALGVAGGDIIAILDGDDYWTPDKLQRQLPAFGHSPEIGLVYGDFMDFSRDDAMDAQLVTVRRYAFESPNQLRDYFVHDGPIMPSTTLIRRDLFSELGLFDETLEIGEDTELFLRIAERARFCYMPGAFLFKRRRAGQITASLDRLLPNAERVTRQYAERHPTLAQYANRRMARFHAKVSMDCARRRERNEAIRHALRAIQLAPVFWRGWITFFAVLAPAAFMTPVYQGAKRIYHLARHAGMDT